MNNWKNAIQLGTHHAMSAECDRLTAQLVTIDVPDDDTLQCWRVERRHRHCQSFHHQWTAVPVQLYRRRLSDWPLSSRLYDFKSIKSKRASRASTPNSLKKIQLTASQRLAPVHFYSSIWQQQQNKQTANNSNDTKQYNIPRKI